MKQMKQMKQQELVRQVLRDLPEVPETPREGQYLSLVEAEAIIADTLDHVQRTGDAREYVYLSGHQRRLAVSLTMIPKAEADGATCLDIGCYGYMAFWAWRHLGYSRVSGIEMTPGAEDVGTRAIEVDGHRLDLTVHNFNIAEPIWPLEGSFDTILFFETLEHVDRDPSGVMLNVTRRMTRDSTLVISVPNAVSYKTLQEFMTGAPPWTYWFFHPDLDHEPRHSFEYTPIFFIILLRSAGLTERAFRTISAYAEPEAIEDIFEIGGALSVEPRLFGETMIAQARKTSDEPLFRYPDCIYDGDRYYRSTYPDLSKRLEAARRAFFDRTRALEAEAQAARHAQSEAQERVREAEELAQARVREAEELAQVRVIESDERVRNAEQRARDAAVACREAMFLCDGYLARLDEAEERGREAIELYRQINSSTFWRATAPLRRLGGRFPQTTKRVRTVLGTPVRLYRHLTSVAGRR